MKISISNLEPQAIQITKATGETINIAGNSTKELSLNEEETLELSNKTAHGLSSIVTDDILRARNALTQDE